MELSVQERLIIANQLMILEKLYPSEADHYTKQRKAVEQGYQLHYESLAEHFYEQMSKEECYEVTEILTMYRAITFSFPKLSDKSGIDASRIKFPGFDGNNETKQHSYTNYLIGDLGRFNELRQGTEYPDFNSHCPMLNEYRQMLKLWTSYTDRFKLNRQNLLDLWKV